MSRIPPKVVDRPLDLLATDDDFRELFTQHRHAAQVQAGYEPSEEELREASAFTCLMVDRLADEEAIADARDQLRSYLPGFGTHTVVFALGADSVPTRLRTG
nr:MULTISPECIES: NHLP-related RiPP peptide [unclassified Streptomyces]